MIARWGNSDQSPDNYIFPFIEPGLERYGIRHKVQLTTHVINENMYAIAAVAGVSQLPSTNHARHAFATLLKKAGKSTEFIRELIGHENLKTTEGYLDDFDDEIKTEISRELLPFRKIEVRLWNPPVNQKDFGVSVLFIFYVLLLELASSVEILRFHFVDMIEPNSLRSVGVGFLFIRIH